MCRISLIFHLTRSVSGAEALVRWHHPKLGVLMPAQFISLFEDNGLIPSLDKYVWRTVAKQIVEWKNTLGFFVPVSVNVSRVDFYDPNLLSVFSSLVEEYDISPRDMNLEITESAYTRESEQIIDKLNSLRSMGFLVEMDDFGTGYSSLNMISSMPIDALKLDMFFIHNAFNAKRDTKLLEIILDIAEYLRVPVIAEGVETAEQLSALKDMGGDIVQGFYFSPPVPSEEFEAFLSERKKTATEDDAVMILKRKNTKKDEIDIETVLNTLSRGYECIYCVGTVNDSYVRFTKDDEGKYTVTSKGDDFYRDIKTGLLDRVYPDDRDNLIREVERESITNNIEKNKSHVINYRVVKNGQPFNYQLKAVKETVGNREYIIAGIKNMHLQTTVNAAPSDLGSVSFDQITRAFARDFISIYYIDRDKHNYICYRAKKAYQGLPIERSGPDFFEAIKDDVRRVVCPDDADKVLEALSEDNFLSAVGEEKSFSLTYRLMLEEGQRYVNLKATGLTTEDGRNLIIIGVNDVDEQIKKELEYSNVIHLVNRDALTGVKNLNAYVEEEKTINGRIQRSEMEPFSIVVCDINGLKVINDTMGHNEGNEHIKKACRMICDIFKHSPVFRVGGDEFAVILRGSDYESRAELIKELQKRNVLTEENDISLASGLSDFVPGEDEAVSDVFDRADVKMYENKGIIKNNG